jgi:hypothetical protein
MATLKHITFTGVDSRTDISELLRIRDKYPLVEFGVLLSEKWAENGNRYFNPDDFYKLTKLGLRLSGHLCGSLARGTVKDGFNRLEVHSSKKLFGVWHNGKELENDSWYELDFTSRELVKVN